MYLYLNSHYSNAPKSNTANKFDVYFAKPIELEGEYEICLVQLDYDAFIWTFTEYDLIKVVSEKEQTVSLKNNVYANIGILMSEKKIIIHKDVKNFEPSASIIKKCLKKDDVNSVIYTCKKGEKIDSNDWVKMVYEEKKTNYMWSFVCYKFKGNDKRTQYKIDWYC